MVVLAFDDVVDDTMMMIWRGRHVKVRDLNKVDNSWIAVVEVQLSSVENLRVFKSRATTVCRWMSRLFNCESMKSGKNNWFNFGGNCGDLLSKWYEGLKLHLQHPSRWDQSQEAKPILIIYLCLNSYIIIEFKRIEFSIIDGVKELWEGGRRLDLNWPAQQRILNDCELRCFVEST